MRIKNFITKCAIGLCLVLVSCENATNKPIDAAHHAFLNESTLPIKTDQDINDLTHLIYIDTSSNSKAHRQIKADIPNQETEALFLVQLRFYKDEFYLYQPCDGRIPILFVDQNAVALRGTHEFVNYRLSDKEVGLDKSIFTVDSLLHVDLKQIILHPSTNYVDVSRVDQEWTDSTSTNFFTTFQKIDRFNAIINNCPVDKTQEFQGFIDPKI